MKQHGYHTAGLSKIFHPDACNAHNNATCGAVETHAVGDDTKAWSAPYWVEPECEQWGSVPCPHDKQWSGGMGPSWLESNLPDEDQTDGQTAAQAVAALHEFASSNGRIGTVLDQDSAAGARGGEFDSRSGARGRVGSETVPFFLAVGFHKPHLPRIVNRKYFDMYPLENVSLAPNPHLPVPYDDAEWYDGSEIRSYSNAHEAFAEDHYGPNTPVDDNEARLERRAYFAATTFVDAQIGKVLDTLNASPFANSTVVTIVSDHGWQ